MAALSVAWKVEQMASEMAELMAESMVDYWVLPRAEKTDTVMAEHLVALKAERSVEMLVVRMAWTLAVLWVVDSGDLKAATKAV